jgi:hypothetical protein
MKFKRQYPNATPYTDCRGKRRWRYRAKGFKAELGTDYGSPEFIERYEAAQQAQCATGRIGANRVAPGTIAALVASWKDSPQYRGWKFLTQRTYGGVAEKLREQHGPKRVAHLETRHIAAIMAEKADHPTAANRLRKTIAMLLDHAMELGWRTDNPARTAKPTRSRAGAITPGPSQRSRSSTESTSPALLRTPPLR